MLLAQSTPPAAVATPPACTTPPPRRAETTVHAPRATLVLEIARTPTEEAIGLMCRTQIAPAHGMIFAFPGGDQEHGFWMKNTLVPLDMVYVRANGTVTSVAANVPASTVDTPDESVARRTGMGSFVIELGAGDAARSGLRPGVRLTLPPALLKNVSSGAANVSKSHAPGSSSA